ncbi:hypothetical protein DFP72DRAFT_612326 [Ephemerocybe angulata]|uniref:Uncharacterized protein n=1 Tax=Ephemerocybe angulata TaxID=980116 RepID=A0A8H6LX97_9AGAR|nr:hypothetical protein DFP72DRAFT_638782 [Tulosesus angulatus]KAF6747139.1 hypothetical protein DFP72DRAFT_612326 [Tulosesus angulatus]
MASTVATALVALLVSLLFVVHQRQRSARRPRFPDSRFPEIKWLLWDKCQEEKVWGSRVIPYPRVREPRPNLVL